MVLASSSPAFLFQIPEGTFGTGYTVNPGSSPHCCFKSRKERLGLEAYTYNLAADTLFQIPEGTFGTHDLYPGGGAMKKVSNPGRNVWDPQGIFY